MKLNTDDSKILVFGKDGRTDAIAAACARSSRPHTLFGYSEYAHAGLLEKCAEVEIGLLTDVSSIRRYAERLKPTLAIIGPEEPLGAGVADLMENLGIPCMGPKRALAQIETSKAWCRDLISRYRIGCNPEYRVFVSTEGLQAYLDRLQEFVIKPDGLTGGKGVRVFGEHIHSVAEGMEYAQEVIDLQGRLVVEEKLVGEEFSLQTLTDGVGAVHCPIVQDHKRAYCGDVGPNTGGMGSYSMPNGELPFLSREDIDRAKAINLAVIEAIRQETGEAYRGVLYGGFIATRSGVRLIEYNARFADPESMNVLPLIDGDFVDICEAIATGGLNRVPMSFRPLATVCKYVVPNEYPQAAKRGGSIRIPRMRVTGGQLETYVAGVEMKGHDTVMTGSRAVAFVGLASTLVAAERIAEEAASSTGGDVRHREDIGSEELVQRRLQHMALLRDAKRSQVGRGPIGGAGSVIALSR